MSQKGWSDTSIPMHQAHSSEDLLDTLSEKHGSNPMKYYSMISREILGSTIYVWEREFG